MSEALPHPPPPEQRVLLGKVVKARGLRGDLKFVSLSWDSQRVANLESVWLLTRDNEVMLVHPKRLVNEGSNTFIRFHEVQDRTSAEAVVGSEIFIAEKDRAELPDEDSYYHDDLVGSEVTDVTHGVIGKVKSVLELGSQDVWQVMGPYGEVLIPVVKAFILKFDTVEKRIQVDLPEGLINIDESE